MRTAPRPREACRRGRAAMALVALGLLLVLAALLAWSLVRGNERPSKEPALPSPPTRLTTEDARALLRERADQPAPRPEGEGQRTRNEEEPGASVAPATTAPVPATPAVALSIGARLIDEGARPLAGGTLAELVPGPFGLPVEGAVARADRSGSVWLALSADELPAQGPLRLVAQGPGCRRRSLEIARARWEGQPLLALDEIQLAAGGTLRGLVQDEGGSPVEGALAALGSELAEASEEVRAMARTWPLLEALERGEAPLLTFTGPEGEYVLEGLPTGRFAVTAALLPRGERLLLPDREEGVLVAPGQETRVRTLVLHEPADEERISGTVRAPDGRPEAGARIVLLDPEGRLRLPAGAESGSDGRFELATPPGRTFTLAAEDAARAWEPVRLGGVRSGTRGIELRFGAPRPVPTAPAPERESPPPATAPSTPPAPAEGTAELDGRLTLGGVAAHGWRVAPVGRRLDHEGAFHLAGLSPGRWTLALSTLPGGAVTRGLWAELVLAPGRNEWTLDVPVGTLAFQNLPRAEALEQDTLDGIDWPEYALTGSGAGFGWTILFQEGEADRVEVNGVPAGHVVLRYRGPGALLDDAEHWPVVLELEVEAGSAVTVRVP